MPEETVKLLKILADTKPTVLVPDDDEDEDDRMVPAHDFASQAGRALGRMKAAKQINQMRTKAKSLSGAAKLDYLITAAFFDKKTLAWREAKADLLKEGDSALDVLRWHLPKADKNAKREILKYLKNLREIDEGGALELYLKMVSSCPPKSRLGDLLKLPTAGENAESTRKVLLAELESVEHRWSSYPGLYEHIAKTYEKPEAARTYLVGVVSKDDDDHKRTGAARVLAKKAVGREALHKLLFSDNKNVRSNTASALVIHFGASGGFDPASAVIPTEDRKQLQLYVEKFPKDGDVVERVKELLETAKGKP